MLNWKRLLATGGIALLVVLFVRGCIVACRQQPSREYGGSAWVGEGTPAPQQQITLYLAEEKQTVVIGLEDYLVGVVAAEMPASFHEEALKAQSVAARTYTLRRIAVGGCASGAQVCSSSKCCQAYDTVAACKDKWGSAYDANMKKVQSAVFATTGEALYYQNELIEALYHAASGGYTEDSENVFASAQPYLRGVKSANEVGSSHLTDEYSFTRKNFVKKINAAWPKAKLKASSLEKQVEITARYPSGRVECIRLGGVSVSGRELRSALGLRSAWFEVSLKADSVIIRTRGYGHGVGMSQAGANGMAQEGAGYREILAHYYTDTSIKR